MYAWTCPVMDCRTMSEMPGQLRVVWQAERIRWFSISSFLIGAKCTRASTFPHRQILKGLISTRCCAVLRERDWRRILICTVLFGVMNSLLNFVQVFRIWPVMHQYFWGEGCLHLQISRRRDDLNYGNDCGSNLLKNNDTCMALHVVSCPTWTWFFCLAKQLVGTEMLLRNRGSTVVKVLCYKSEGRWFDSRWCHGIFHWHNSSDRNVALESTQPLTEMSTRSISWG